MCYFLCVGFIIFTVLTMYSLFWLIYILRLLLVLIYPLPSSRVYKLIRNRKIQIMEVACVLIVSVIPNVVLATSSQFHVSSYPPVSCGASTELTFYGCVIPTTSTNFISLIIMLFVLHKIHSVSQLIVISVLYCYILVSFCSTPRAETKWQKESHVFLLLKLKFLSYCVTSLS